MVQKPGTGRISKGAVGSFDKNTGTFPSNGQDTGVFMPAVDGSER